MKCSNCGAEIGANQKFCISCGMPAPNVHYCTSCGSQVPAGTAFCSSCGAAQTVGSVAPAPPGPQPGYQPAPQPQPAHRLASQAQPTHQPTSSAAALEYKGIGMRFVAFIIDMVLYFILAWVVAAKTGNTNSQGFEMTGAPALLTFAIWAAYYVLLEAFVGGTIGKLVLGMRIVNAQGEAPGLVPALTRNVLRIIDFLPLFYILGAILVLASKEKQRLGDRVAGTFVVSKSRAEVGAPGGMQGGMRGRIKGNPDEWDFDTSSNQDWS